jgi:hypothetical protein
MKTKYGIFAKERVTLACYVNIFEPSKITMFSISHWKCCFTNVVAWQMSSHRIANFACIKKNFFLQVEKLKNLWQ